MKLFRNNIAQIGTPVKGDVTDTTIAVTGSVEFFKDGTWGVAYKKASASSWTHKPSTSQDISMTLTSLTAETAYDIKLYVKFNGVYQYGTAIEATTEATPVEPEPESEPANP